VKDAEAQFATRFSLSVGEEYNDNIFFSTSKEHDFITFFTPTLSFLYTPPAETFPIFRANISPSGQIFARHGELNNFGENLSANTGYTYRYSPRLSFHLADTLQLRGSTRTSLGGEEDLEVRRTPTAQPPPGGAEPRTESQRLGDFLSTGDTLTNFFSFQGRFLYAPNIGFIGRYATGYTNFLDQGGNETSHSLNARGVYNWRKEHNLHAGYGISVINSRDGDDNVVHTFDIGDDYFTTRQIQLAPTWTLSGSTGVSLLTGSGGTRLKNNSTLTLIKVWETATLRAGMRKGVTESFGVAGPSDTTTFFAGFNARVTERLTGTAGVDYSMFDTEDVNFNTFQAHAGLQYAITHWLCSNLRYGHRWRDSGAGASNTDLLTRGNVHANSVLLVFSAHFDVWPSLGLAKETRCPITPAVARPPLQ
jgi:hypothetical protein